MLAEFGKPAHHRAVFGKQPVAVQFAEIDEGGLEVIQRERTFGMAGQLDPLPGGEVGKNLPPGFLQFLFDELDFLLETDAERMFFSGCFFEFLQLVLQFDDRLLEIELMFHAWGSLAVFRPQGNANSTSKKKRAGLASGS